MKRVLWVIGLMVAVGLLAAGLALAQGTKAPAKTTPAPAAAPAPAPAPAPAAPAKKEETKPADTLERYWKMKIEKLEAEKQRRQDEISAYEKKEAATKAGKAVKEAQANLQNDLKAAQDKYGAAIKEIAKKYEDVQAETQKTVKNKRQALTAKRVNWLKKHPEVTKQRNDLEKDLRALKAKLSAHKPKPKKAAPAATPKKTTP